MMSKEDILSEIRRVAQERGGRVGLAAFLKTTGIPEKQTFGRHWATWNEALTEAGIAMTSFRRPRTAEASVLEAVAQSIQRLKKWPTENELSLERHRNSSFPSLKVFRRLRRSGSLTPKVQAHSAGRPDLVDAARIASQQSMQTVPEVSPIGRAPVQGYVYMMRSGRRYKIGHTTSPSRRHREVRLDLPDPTSLVHSIETNDPSGIDSCWHHRFESKQVRDTEFFTVDASEVAAFKRRKYQ